MAERTQLDDLVYTMSADVSRLSKDVKTALDVIKKSTVANQAEFDRGGHAAGQVYTRALSGEIGKGVALNRTQMMELAHVGRSVFDGLAAGQNPMRLLAMEGGRLAEVFGMGSHGVGGAMAALGTVFNPVTVGIAAVTAVLLGAVAATLAYEDEQRKLMVTMLGMGAASGMTVKSMNDIAEAAARVDKMSVAMNRSAEVAFATIGHVSEANMPKAIGLLRDYAVLTGQKAPDALKELAKAFEDPAKGAEELNNKLFFLNTQQLETIRHMQESGDRAGALKVLLADLGGVTDGAATHMSGLSAALEQVGKAFSDAFDNAGQFMVRMADPQMGMNSAQLEKALGPDMARMRQALKNPFQPDKEDIAAILKGDEDRIAQAKAQETRAKQAPLNKAMADQEVLIRQADPKFLKIEADKALITGLQAAVKAPIPGGRSVAELTEALHGAMAKLARDERGEMRTPRTKAAPKDKFPAELAGVERQLSSPDENATREYFDQLKVLNEALAKGAITQNKYTELLQSAIDKRNKGDDITPVKPLEAIRPDKEPNLVDTSLTFGANKKGGIDQGPLADYFNGIRSLNVEMQNAAVDGIQSLNQGIIDVALNGGKAGDVLKNILNRVLSDFLNAELDQGEQSLFSHFKIGAPHAAGGPVKAGTLYPINERGLEGFVPNVDGYVVPNHAMTTLSNLGGGAMTRAGGGGAAVYAPLIQFPLDGIVEPFRSAFSQMNGRLRQQHEDTIKAVKKGLPGWQSSLNSYGTIS